MIKIEAHPDVSEEYINELKEAFEALPEYVFPFLVAAGYRIIAGKRLIGLHSDLHGYESASGFYAPTIKTLFFAETRYNKLTEEWEKHSKAKASVFHEVGHFLDFEVLGNGNYPGGFFSLKSPFIESFNKDKEVLEVGDFEKFDEVYSSFSETETGMSLLKDHFNEVACSPEEIIAELWAQENGFASGMPEGLAELMPNCAEIVKKLHETVLPMMGGYLLPKP